MQVNYQLDTTQLDMNFIESIKTLFGNAKIDIVIRSEEVPRNDTEYLLSNKKNAKKLIKSIENIEKYQDKLDGK